MPRRNPVNIIKFFISAVEENDCVKLSQLHLLYPSVNSHTSYETTCECSFGCRDRVFVSIDDILISDGHYGGELQIAIETYDALINLRILSIKNTIFIQEFIENCFCVEMCDRFFEIFDRFDLDTMAKYLWINNDCIKSLISFSLLDSCILSNYSRTSRVKYVNWVNKMLDAGCNMIFRINGEGVDWSDNVLLEKNGYCYVESTNMIKDIVNI
jgi:hypothetical protein